MHIDCAADIPLEADIQVGLHLGDENRPQHKPVSTSAAHAQQPSFGSPLQSSASKHEYSNGAAAAAAEPG
jgi:hypothetical protein